MKLNKNFEDLLNSIGTLINQIELEFGPKLMEVFLKRLLMTTEEYKHQLDSSIKFKSRKITESNKINNNIIEQLNEINMPVFFKEYQKKIKN